LRGAFGAGDFGVERAALGQVGARLEWARPCVQEPHARIC